MIYDYIIIGGGSAGCVAAARLVEDHDASVLMLEAGAHDNGMLSRMPAGTFKMMFSNSPNIKRYISSPQQTLAGRSVPIAQARVLGGGSAVNMMAYMRGSRSDYQLWTEITGDPGWSWEGLLPYFKRQEGNIRLDNAVHGADGPQKVSDPLHICEGAQIFVRTLQRRNVPFVSDLASGELGGVGYIQTNTFGGERCSAATAFVRPLSNNRKLHVATLAHARRILFAGRKATDVEYMQGGAVMTATARREIILAAGAFETPKLLMLSGIGPKDVLEKHGIAPLSDLPGVGQNLQDHAMVAVAMATDSPYGYFGEDKGLRALRNLVQYRLFRSGPIASNGGEAAAFVRMDAAAQEPEIQLYFVGIVWPDAQGNRAARHGVSLAASLLSPRSAGSVTLRTGDPEDDPVVDLNWLADEEDQKAMIAAMKYMRSIAATPPFSDMVAHEIRPGSAVQSDDDLLDYCRKTVGTNYHPVGTCRMGRDDDPLAVLTADLKVRGVEGLRVFDASAMPKIIRSNTNATVMALADRGVALMTGAESR